MSRREGVAVRPWLRIMRHEWRILARDRTVLVVAGLLAVLVGAGVLNGTAWVRHQRETIRLALDDEARRLQSLREQLALLPDGDTTLSFRKDPRHPGAVGGSLGARYAVLSPGPLAALSVGQSDLYPSYYRVTTSGPRSALVHEEIENPTNLQAGRFDPAFVVVFLFPLVILVLSYNLLAGEKEDGTLALLLSQPVSLGTVLLGKVLARAGLVLALAFGLSAGTLLLGGIDVSADGAWLRLGCWGLLVLAYAGFWFGLALCVNALGRGTAANAVILTAAWLALVFVVPAFVNLFVTSLHPLPSRIQMVHALRQASLEAGREGTRLLSAYDQDHPELLPPDARPDPSDFLRRVYVVREQVDRAMQPVLARYEAGREAQHVLVSRYRFVSPAIVMQGALNDLAGAGWSRRRRFEAQVERFTREWKAFFLPKVLAKARLSRADYEALPRFHYVEEPVGPVLNHAVAEAVWLADVGLALALGAIAVLRTWPRRGLITGP